MSILNLTRQENTDWTSVEIDGMTLTEFLRVHGNINPQNNEQVALNERSRLTIHGGREPLETKCLFPQIYIQLTGLVVLHTPKLDVLGVILGIVIAGIDQKVPPIQLRPCKRIRTHIAKLTKGTGGVLISITEARANVDIIATISKDSNGNVIVTANIPIDAKGMGEAKLVIPTGETDVKGEVKIEQVVMAANDPDNATNEARDHQDKQTLVII